MSNEDETKGVEDETKDIEELREVLRTVRQEVPGLLHDIIPPVKELMAFSITEEQATEKAKAISAFYKELVASGMDKDLAMKLTEKQFIPPMEIAKEFLSKSRPKVAYEHHKEVEPEEEESEETPK